jgi:heme A synthase
MGAPLAAIAFVLALVARVRYHDRSLLVLLSLVVGLLQALFPALFVLLQPAS